ncbi:hypothetical protein [Amycolatopsis sacchari]|uniref:Uncharacterized protein n=1 Tax=Amycolatopsis sacchari TaxID=115433 RepID=A0A1I3TEE1_9PSEU|nr:hypothetical protein [Amycolatopsis sacchari]SFJ69528.1 hypothetical protein SAMN05421835_107289 [Amycolatopsis sacchari]
MSDPLGTEQPVEDVLEQRQEVSDPAVDVDPALPAEADPADYAEQQRPVADPDVLDEEDREYG